LTSLSVFPTTAVPTGWHVCSILSTRTSATVALKMFRLQIIYHHHRCPRAGSGSLADHLGRTSVDHWRPGREGKAVRRKASASSGLAAGRLGMAGSCCHSGCCGLGYLAGWGSGIGDLLWVNGKDLYHCAEGSGSSSGAGCICWPRSA
jgi:hypothetical protein